MNDKDEVDEGSKKEVGILDVRPAMATRNRSKSRRVSVGFTTRGVGAAFGSGVDQRKRVWFYLAPW
jgi:hypothetical protein